VCAALLPDLEVLEAGDAMEIGTRLVIFDFNRFAQELIVGSKAIYVLLDDPLGVSALLS
jgi:hypothetical protein